MPIRKSVVGIRYGMLLVKADRPVEKGKSLSVCMCDCGKECVIRNDHLKDGRYKSCGCNRGSSLRTHGMSHTAAYGTWESMIRRCHNKNCPEFSNYGGRGIFVCQKWRESFESFHSDLGERPLGASIDRIDNNKGYEPGNCRWATKAEQVRNTRRNRFFTVRGVTACLRDLSKHFGVPFQRVESRIRLGWSVQDALFCKKLKGKEKRQTFAQ